LAQSFACCAGCVVCLLPEDKFFDFITVLFVEYVFAVDFIGE